MAENDGRGTAPLGERLGWDRQPPADARPVAPGRAGATPPRRPQTAPTGRPGPQTSQQTGSRPAPGAGRHCWVVDCPQVPPGRWPGLLVEWTRQRDGWRGRVVLLVPGALGPTLVTLWVAAKHLRPL